MYTHCTAFLISRQLICFCSRANGPVFSDDRLHSPSPYKNFFMFVFKTISHVTHLMCFCSQIVLHNLNTWIQRAYSAYKGIISYPSVCYSLHFNASASRGPNNQPLWPHAGKVLKCPNMFQALYTLNKAIIIHLFSAKLNFLNSY